MKLHQSFLPIVALATGINGFSGPNAGNAVPEVSRRESFAKVASMIGGVSAGIVATSFPNAAFAAPSEETERITTRMGGLLVSSSFIIILIHSSMIA